MPRLLRKSNMGYGRHTDGAKPLDPNEYEPYKPIKVNRMDVLMEPENEYYYENRFRALEELVEEDTTFNKMEDIGGLSNNDGWGNLLAFQIDQLTYLQ